MTPETPRDESMEISPADDLGHDADIGGKDLHMADMGNTTDVKKEADQTD